MNGLLRRLTRRRAATADEPPPDSPAASEPVDATVVSHEEGTPLSEEERAREEELRRRRRDLPAGLDADRLERPLGEGARRGALRHRIRFLQAARELLLRDLGGFVYELHRTAHDIEAEAHRRLRETKLARLTRVDAELHELETLLDDVRRQVLVREPGVGGECPHCGELFGSAAHYCSHCGNPLTEAARRELAKAHQPAAEPTPVVAEPKPLPAAATADQPTQEIGPLDPNAAFQWPARRDASTPVGEGEPATTLHAAGDEGPRDAAADQAQRDAAADQAPRDDATTTAGEAPPEEATSAAEAPDEAATPVGEGDPATAIRAAGDDAPRAADDEAPLDEAADDAPREDLAAAADDAPREDVAAAADDAPREDAAPADDAAPRDGAGEARSASNGAASGDAGSRDYETWRGEAANGRDDSIFSPVERRQ
jgi:hypothetical protein